MKDAISTLDVPTTTTLAAAKTLVRGSWTLPRPHVIWYAALRVTRLHLESIANATTATVSPSRPAGYGRADRSRCGPVFPLHTTISGEKKLEEALAVGRQDLGALLAVSGLGTGDDGLASGTRRERIIPSLSRGFSSRHSREDPSRHYPRAKYLCAPTVPKLPSKHRHERIAAQTHICSRPSATSPLALRGLQRLDR